VSAGFPVLMVQSKIPVIVFDILSFDVIDINAAIMIPNTDKCYTSS